MNSYSTFFSLRAANTRCVAVERGKPWTLTTPTPMPLYLILFSPSVHSLLYYVYIHTYIHTHLLLLRTDNLWGSAAMAHAAYIDLRGDPMRVIYPWVALYIYVYTTLDFHNSRQIFPNLRYAFTHSIRIYPFRHMDTCLCVSSKMHQSIYHDFTSISKF